MLKQLLLTGIAGTLIIGASQASAHTLVTSSTWANTNHSHHNAQPKRNHAPAFRVNQEQRQQATMIKQGIKTCRITPKEARRLQNEQQDIKRLEQKMRRGGLTQWERNTLKSHLHNARVNINRLTKNNVKCGSQRHHNNSHGHRGNNIHGSSTWNSGSVGGSATIWIAN